MKPRNLRTLRLAVERANQAETTTAKIAAIRAAADKVAGDAEAERAVVFLVAKLAGM